MNWNDHRFGTLAASVLASLMTMTALAPPIVRAQGTDDPLLRSQREGMRIIRRGIDAHGGLDRLRAIHTVRLDARVSNIALGQELRPGDEPADGNTLVLRQIRDLDTGRRIYEVVASDTATQVMSRLVYDADAVTVYSPGANMVQRPERAFVERTLRQLPYAPGILLDALERASTVRALPPMTIAGERYDVVTYATKLGVQHALLFDARTGLLRRSRFIEDHAQFGDHIAEVRYDDYRNVTGVLLPQRTEGRVGEYRAGNAEFVRTEFDVAFDEAQLEIPDDASEGPAAGVTAIPATELTVEQLGDGVYLIPNASPSYNVLFVELADQVLVLEAVVSPAVATAVMQKIHETVPTKPIGIVAITHHHFDHSGGLWPYIAAGARVVTTEGNVEFVRSIGHAPRTLAGFPETAEPVIEVVRDRRTYGAGAQRVELHQVGPNAHVDEMLIAYLPALKLMFVADVYSFTGQVRPLGPELVTLADRLETLRLEIETVVPVHGQPTSGANFWEGVRLTRGR